MEDDLKTIRRYLLFIAYAVGAILVLVALVVFGNVAITVNAR